MTSTIKIYVDLDGVLVDFQKMAFEIAGIRMTDDTEKHLRRDFWKSVDRHVAAGKPFFSAMDPLHDAFVLWDYIKDRSPEILSATGHVRGAAAEKRSWVRKHLGDTVANSAHFVRDGADKAKFATPNSILIDDRAKVLAPWEAAGGIAILHTSAISTIEALRKLEL